jgi:hypothetical protein
VVKGFHPKPTHGEGATSAPPRGLRGPYASPPMAPKRCHHPLLSILMTKEQGNHPATRRSLKKRMHSPPSGFFTPTSKICTAAKKNVVLSNLLASGKARHVASGTAPGHVGATYELDGSGTFHDQNCSKH